MADTGDLKHLPLEDLHRAAGARFGAFAGWSMPITYPAGVMKEHLHTREHAGLFDISHMKLFVVEGPGAADALSRACPLDAAGLEPSQSKYTFFLDEAAGILDDLIVTRTGPKRFVVVANAGNAEADERHLKAVAAGFDCTVEPLDRVFLALQGPDTEDVLRKAGLDLSALTFMHGAEPRENWFASRSGYTGEDGFEVALPPAEAHAFAGKLLADERVMWVGLKPEGRQPVRAGIDLVDGAGQPAGRVTSGGFGPSAGAPVAMGYVRADLAAQGTELFAEIRGNRIPLRVHALPFTPHRYRKG